MFDDFQRRSGRTLLALVLVLVARTTLAGDQGPTLVEQEEDALRSAVAAIAPSVVQVRTLGGFDEVDDVLIGSGPTTGLAISADGYILTSAFAFAQQPSSILVTTADGRQAPAELVATDHSRMLVLLKASSLSDLAVPTFVPDEEVQVGMWAVAVGRALDTERPTTAVGIVSARQRMFGKVAQTDAAVSPANYGGPLIDLYGRVIGLIVPIAPQSDSQVAGVEWYDSGIGFAAGLASLGPALERMKKGEDLYAGQLGIVLSKGIAHRAPAEIESTRVQSPAAQADLRKGDRIVAVDGQPVENQTDLRFLLGPRYAGEDVTLTIARGDETFDRSLELAGPFETFRHAGLGILPRREPSASDDEEDGEAAPAGVVVRAVLAESPADEADIKAGDRLWKINDTELRSVDDAMAVMAAVAIGGQIQVVIERDSESLELDVTVARLSTDVPTDLPSAYELADDDPALGEADDERIAELKLAEFPNECKLYVPTSSDDGIRPGVLFWLHAPGRIETDDMLTRWAPLCEKHHFMLVAPMAADPSRWERNEREYLERLVARVLGEYDVDPQRIALHGTQGGGGMAYLVGMSMREQVAGISVAAAALPRWLKPPENTPTNRLLLRSASAQDDPQQRRIRLGLRKLDEAGYLVSQAALEDRQGILSRDEREALARWFDTLDRF